MLPDSESSEGHWIFNTIFWTLDNRHRILYTGYHTWSLYPEYHHWFSNVGYSALPFLHLMIPTTIFRIFTVFQLLIIQIPWHLLYTVSRTHLVIFTLIVSYIYRLSSPDSPDHMSPIRHCFQDTWRHHLRANSRHSPSTSGHKIILWDSGYSTHSISINYLFILYSLYIRTHYFCGVQIFYTVSCSQNITVPSHEIGFHVHSSLWDPVSTTLFSWPRV